MVVGERLKSRLEQTGISQAELGRRVGLTQGAISHLISGDSRGSKHLHKIARALGTTPAYLVGETDDPESVAPDVDLTPEEEELLTIFRELGKEDQAVLKRLIQRLQPRTDRGG